MNLKKLVLTGAIFLTSLNLFSQDTIYPRSPPEKQTQKNYVVRDLNGNGEKDSLFWKRSSLYKSEGFFPKDYVDYSLHVSKSYLGELQPPKEIHKFSYRVRNGKIPDCPKRIFYNVCSQTKKVKFWENQTPKIASWYPKLYHDQYEFIEINFRKPNHWTENPDTIINTTVNTNIQKYICPSEYFP